MVKNKKMSKSAIAIIVLSLLLVLSMVMGLTGAWFTDQKSGTDKSGKIEFGTVKVLATGSTFQYFEDGYEDLQHMVDGDIVEATAASINNASDVAVFYKYTIGYALYANEACTTLASAEQKALFKLKVGTGEFANYADASVTKYGFMIAADGSNPIASQAALQLKLDSNGTANQKDSEQGNNSWTVIADGLYFKVTVEVKAVQAGNIATGNLVSELGCDATAESALIAFRDAATPVSAVYNG